MMNKTITYGMRKAPPPFSSVWQISWLIFITLEYLGRIKTTYMQWMENAKCCPNPPMFECMTSEIPFCLPMLDALSYRFLHFQRLPCMSWISQAKNKYAYEITNNHWLLLTQLLINDLLMINRTKRNFITIFLLLLSFNETTAICSNTMRI